MDEEGLETCSVRFYLEGYYNHETKQDDRAYMVSLPQSTNTELKLTKDMEEQAIFDIQQGIYYFRVTERQWSELTNDFFEARRVAELNIKEVTFSYQELFTAGKPSLHSEYTEAIKAYEDFLAGKLYISLEDENEKTKVTIAPNHGGKYTIMDMNEDGVPELITNVIILQYRDKDNNMYASTFTCGIYSYQDGEIVNWYGAGDDSFELLSNKELFPD